MGYNALLTVHSIDPYFTVFVTNFVKLTIYNFQQTHFTYFKNIIMYSYLQCRIISAISSVQYVRILKFVDISTVSIDTSQVFLKLNLFVNRQSN